MIPAHAQWTVLPVTRIITEIEKRKSPDEYAVFVDGEYAFKVDAELLFRLGLKVGEVIDPETEAKVLAEAELGQAKSRALRLLSVRPRTVAEIERRLGESGFGQRVVEEVVAWLRHLGYLDDEAFARGWIDSRVRHKPMGARRLELELRRKGVDKETAKGALSGITQAQEVEWAFEVASRRLARMKNEPREIAQRRLFGFLERRGFRHDVIWAVISRLLPQSFD